MADEKFLKLKAIFNQAIELSGKEREDFLSKLDSELRGEIDKLIISDELSENFIKTPAVIEFGLNVNPLIHKVIGNYKLLEVIGTGGMGTVFLAEKEGFEKKFAIKLIKRGMDTDEVLRRFKLERQILARLEHPNITPLLDGGMTEDGLPYLVMEYVDGISVTRYCNENRLKTSERLKLFRQICSAVSYAHQNLVIHRDLKPSNIFVTKDGTPKLLDFGIAKLINPDEFEDTATTLQKRMFTPEYASPEQINGLPITTASDVYSLGVVLYELLSGIRPFQNKSGNYQEIVNAVLTEEPLRPSSVISNESSAIGKTTPELTRQTNPKSEFQNPKSLIGDLDNIILKSLRKEPLRRYQSVQEFSEDIRRNLEGLPVSATADTSFYRLSKFVQRHKKGVFAGVAVFLLITIISSIAIWQGIVATRERQKSEKRLIEIRKVAKSLMTETNDSLEKIPGNVAVQKALTEKSVALLDNLANDEVTDETLLIELADAYTKLSEIQNLSLREYDKSGENIRKAEVIYKRVLERSPNELSYRGKLYRLQMRKIEYLRTQNDKAELFKTCDESIDNQEKIILIEPDNPTHSANLAALYFGISSLHRGFGENEEAINKADKGIELIDKAIELQKSQNDDFKAANEIPRFLTIKANLQRSIGQIDKSVESYQFSAKLAEKTYLDGKEFIGNFYRIVGSYKSIGEIFESQENYQKALDNYLTAKDWAKRGLKDKNITNRIDIILDNCQISVNIAGVFANIADKSKAEVSFAEAEKVCKEGVSTDTTRNESIIEVLGEFYAISDFYFENGEKEKSINLLQYIIQKIEPVLEKNENDFEAAFSLADTFEKLGDYHKDKQAKDFYQKSFQIWTDYQKKYQFLPDELERMEALQKKL